MYSSPVIYQPLVFEWLQLVAFSKVELLVEVACELNVVLCRDTQGRLISNSRYAKKRSASVTSRASDKCCFCEWQPIQQQTDEWLALHWGAKQR
jgi:hypothetical protein